MSWRARVAAGLLLVISGGAAWAQTSPPVADGRRTRAAELKMRTRRANAAYAHRAWEEAVFQLREALTIAPDDAGLRDKLRRALERRARLCEARAAHPPPPPLGIADGPRKGMMAIMLDERRWHASLKHAALEARTEAEAARPNPDEQKLAQLRRELAAVQADEDEMARKVAAENKQEAAEQAARAKAFEGVGALGLGLSPPAPAERTHD